MYVKTHKHFGNILILLIVTISPIISLLRHREIDDTTFQQHRRLGGFHQTPGNPHNASNPLWIAWLVSFPNSGTTFTHSLVLETSRRNVANNYGTIVQLPSGKFARNYFPSTPVFSDRTNGPYLSSDLPLPSKYILTKTHCGGYCATCSPGRYFIKQFHFLMQCHTGYKYVPPQISEPGCCGEHQMVRYDGYLVKKAIHLVRDPIDNVVARFHHEYKLNAQKDESFVEEHQYSADGVQRWCQEMNDMYAEQELTWFPVMEKFPDVPCRSEFFKYIQWHNHAIFTINEMKLESMVIYYDDFHLDYENTVDAIMRFLELEKKNEPPKFFWHTHDDVFTKEQVQNIWMFLTAFASDSTMKLIERYVYREA